MLSNLKGGGDLSQKIELDGTIILKGESKFSLIIERNVSGFIKDRKLPSDSKESLILI